jgi:phospholipid/cholesterol/gamma-HCH transport system ATP-binding protein
MNLAAAGRAIPAAASEEGKYAIRLRGLTKRFGSQAIFEKLDLDVMSGEILGIAGGSGTGKSVLLRTVLGLLPFDAGTIEVFGKNFPALSGEERIAVERRWGVLFQDGALFSSLTVLQNVQVPMREHLDLPHRTMDELALLKIAMVGLPEDAPYKYPSELSGGMRKRAGLARALALDPDIVFLDEPTSGLDPIAAAAFDRLIHNLQRTLGLTVYMITHDLDSIFAVCDRVAVLADKHVVREGAPMDLVRDPGHPWVREYFCGERGRNIVKAS